MAIRNLPLRGAFNPSSAREGTNPGLFANSAAIGGPLSFSSPDTPGMPAPSDKTAWDFLPVGWKRAGELAEAPAGFNPITQLESARLGIVTAEMKRVAAREPHLPRRLDPDGEHRELASAREGDPHALNDHHVARGYRDLVAAAIRDLPGRFR